MKILKMRWHLYVFDSGWKVLAGEKKEGSLGHVFSDVTQASNKSQTGKLSCHMIIQSAMYSVGLTVGTRQFLLLLIWGSKLSSKWQIFSLKILVSTC